MADPLYQTAATTKGGRDGRASLDAGGLALAMSLPKSMGGAGDGMNPEQLFALGYSSCFCQAVLAMGKKHGVDASTARVTASVTLDKDATSFALAVELKIQIPGVDADRVRAIVEDAHQICPYSKATRGNVDVILTVV